MEKKPYLAPLCKVEGLREEDIVMISVVDGGEEKTIPSISWGDMT